MNETSCGGYRPTRRDANEIEASEVFNVKIRRGRGNGGDESLGNFDGLEAFATKTRGACRREEIGEPRGGFVLAGQSAAGARAFHRDALNAEVFDLNQNGAIGKLVRGHLSRAGDKASGFDGFFNV